MAETDCTSQVCGKSLENVIETIAERLAATRTKGELGVILGEEISRYSMQDLQVIGGRFVADMAGLPKEFHNELRPRLAEGLFGAHHQIVTLYRSGKFLSMAAPIAHPETFRRFCRMIPYGCLHWDEHVEQTPFPYTERHRLFYYLISAFSMFVMDRPGHPVGTPFPGGSHVEEQNGTLYCPVRDREKEVSFSLCNYCPALQTPGR
ncbi:DUF2115 domain-containing protein [Methanosphaerula palustris]|uniref:UPF0305 protein Mpal_1481 n=1 Tax=Methanosphaerula palustris (strain ATCC BAA-1556 / DSM 19958 / E1-9c) TaxID=521011 RepID=B8GII9_METPE|nr:DUF2115 domain-containing protein [Methanosphaerula palustris]ACL16802.1 conserved hypothetical protein [Methanosphaerula palustris E1-9c]